MILNNNMEKFQPVSRKFGFDRGTPIDRKLMEKFLLENQSLITGKVLEIGDDAYTKALGKNLISSDVLNYVPSEIATIIGDLSTGKNIPQNYFDCFILTQTIHVIYDYKASLKNAFNCLADNGALLITAPGISQISRYDMDRWGDYWRFTTKSLERLIQELFPDAEYQIESKGNVYLAKCFLDGLAAEEIENEAFEFNDPDYQLLITAVIRKKTAGKHNSSEYKQNPFILLYHRVSDDPIDSQLLSVSPGNFEEQLFTLKENYNIVSLSEIIDDMQNSKSSYNKVAITFDDGYLDNLLNALPVLEKYGAHATIFVSAGLIGSKDEFWWDKLERIFLASKTLPAYLSISNSESEYYWPLNNPEERIKAFYDLHGLMLTQNSDNRDSFIKGLYNWAGLEHEGRISHRILNEEQLKKLSQSEFIEIGAHGVTHCRMSTLSYEEQRAEIIQSKLYIEKITGKKIRYFSYPFGTRNDFNESTIRILKEVGFEAAVANYPGEVNYETEIYSLPRLLVRDWNKSKFEQWLFTSERKALEAAAISQRNNRFIDILKKNEKTGR